MFKILEIKVIAWEVTKISFSTQPRISDLEAWNKAEVQLFL